MEISLPKAMLCVRYISKDTKKTLFDIKKLCLNQNATVNLAKQSMIT